MVDTDFAMSIFSHEPEIAVHRFGRFMNEKAEDIGYNGSLDSGRDTTAN